MQSTRYANSPAESRGPEVLYGYCHDSRRMRMMDYSDFMSNLGRGYSNLYQAPAGMAAIFDPAANAVASDYRRQQGGCCHDEQEDCSCNCCIQCADVVQYAYCSETRKIPITFDNDTRRERQVSLQMGGFSTDSGNQLPWKASLSETKFTLGPCSRKSIFIAVNIDCGQGSSTEDSASTGAAGNVPRIGTVESCRVGYARLVADGCLIRPIIVAIAVLPDHCRAHRISCLCGCCC